MMGSIERTGSRGDERNAFGGPMQGMYGHDNPSSEELKVPCLKGRQIGVHQPSHQNYLQHI